MTTTTVNHEFDDDLKEQLGELIRQRQEMKMKIADMEAQIKNGIDATIEVVMSLLGTRSTVVNTLDRNWSVVVSAGRKDSLNAMKLVMAGVTEAQLIAGTTKGKPYTSVTVKDKDAKKKGKSTDTGTEDDE